MNFSNVLKLMFLTLVFQVSNSMRAMSHEDELNLASALSLSEQTAKEEEKKRQDDKTRQEDQIALDAAIALALSDGAVQPAVMPAPAVSVQQPTASAPAAPVPQPAVPAKPAEPKKQQNTCSICLDDEVKEIVELSCKHAYCKNCLTGLVDTAIKDKSSKGLRCPEPKCKAAISHADVTKITQNQEKIKEIGEIQFKEWILLAGDAKNCPTPGCTYVFIKDGGAPHNVQCPKCTKHYCSGCYFPHGKDMSCKDAVLANDKNAADKANLDWIKKNTKACPHCNVAVQKNGGCRFMDCISCHKEFCWVCLAKTAGHADHGCPGGPGYHMVD